MSEEFDKCASKNSSTTLDGRFNDFVQQVTTDPKANNFTHVRLYNPHTNLNISVGNYGLFWHRYCDLVDEANNGRDGVPRNSLANICLAERNQDNQPLIVTLLFTFNVNKNERLRQVYDATFLQSICHIYQMIIMEYFIVERTKYELCCVVLESTDYYYVADSETSQQQAHLRVRLQFPYSRIDSSVQSRIIRSRAIQLLRNKNVLAKMHKIPIGDWEQIIDVNVCNEPVIMYGSCDQKYFPKLELTHIWRYIHGEHLDNGSEIVEFNLAETFVLETHSHIQRKLFTPNKSIKDISFWLPLFLSLEYWPIVLQVKTEITHFIRNVLEMPNNVTEDNKFTRHKNMGIELMKIGLSGTHCDVAAALLFCCFKPLEIMDINNCHSIIYDEDEKRIYLWNEDNKLWEYYNEFRSDLHPKVRSIDNIVSRYVACRTILSKQIKECNDETVKSTLDISFKKTTSLVAKLKTRVYSEHIWTEVLECIGIKFSTVRYKVSEWLPLNDGTLFNVLTHESRIRTPKDYYTFAISAQPAVLQLLNL